MDPYSNGNASGLTVACTFVSGTAAGLNLTMQDAYDATADGTTAPAGALYHYGAARLVNVTVGRSNATTFSPNNILKSCATNNTIAAVTSAACPAPGGAPGNLAFSQADVNRSVEYPTSSATMTGVFIQPGTFIVCVGAGCTPAIAATSAKISKPLINAATPAPCAAACATTPSVGVLVSHGTNRAVTDGVTNAASATVSSATAHFCGAPGATTGSCVGKSDVGARVSAGDLPDGATILTVTNNTTAVLDCTGCTSGFTFVSSATAQPMSIDPATPTTTTRYIADGTLGGASNRTITSATARFNANDVGLKVVTSSSTTNTATGPLGKRIGTVVSATQATIIGGGAAALTAGATRITLGVPTKTAPVNGAVVGTLAISLQVNPLVSPTSPPCAASKISAFHIPWQWRNPGGYGLVDNSPTLTHVEGKNIAGTSIGQMIFLTPSTSFAGFIKQNGSSNGTLLTTTNYTFRIEFAPITVGVCPGTPFAETLSFIGIPVNVAQNPTNTGGGGGGFRALSPVPDGHSVLFTGSEGVNVVAGGSDPTDSNACTISSPNVFAFPSPCQG